MDAIGEAGIPVQNASVDDAQPSKLSQPGEAKALGSKARPFSSKKPPKGLWMGPAVAANLVILAIAIALLCVYASFQDTALATDPAEKWLVTFAVVIGLSILDMILLTLIYAIFRSRKYEVLDWFLLTLVPVVLGIAAWAVLAASLGTPMA